MIDPFLVTNYVASKICHDVVSPLSVVSQSLEMLDMPIDATSKKEYEDLLRETTGRLVSKVEFLRFVFGSQGLSSGQADLPLLKRVAAGYAGLSEARLDWQLSETALSFAHMRVLLSLVLLASDALPRGGTIVAASRAGADGGIDLSVEARAEKVTMRDDIADALAGREPREGWQAKNIHALFARQLAERFGTTLAASMKPGQLVLAVSGVPAMQQA